MPDPSAVRFILLDIEGTTTPIDFVYRTLFPYARGHMRQFLARHAGETDVQEDLSALRAQHDADLAAGLNPPAWDAASPAPNLDAANYAEWLIDRDSKCGPLKSLQGKIWQEGYRAGELRGEVYPDVPAALSRWRSQARRAGIYSSGSVLAQKLLFGSTNAGDLTPLLEAHFDTGIGAKTSPPSYANIAAALKLRPDEILFISDVAKELDAAEQAGMQTALCLREASAAPETPPVRRSIASFDEIFPQ